MSDLLVRNINQHLKRRLAASARKHRRNLSEEAKMLLERALLKSRAKSEMGTALLELALIFEVPNDLIRFR
jgi:plasmid stability protein